MFNTPMARRGMVTAPHHLAAQAGLAVLRDGGNAIEAAVAAAAMLCVVHPHVNGLGGDGFWLIAEPGKPPVSIDGSGASGAKVDVSLYRAYGLEAVPAKGPLAANTVAGVVSGWQLALDVSSQWGGRLPLSRLFEDATGVARGGFAVTRAQAEAMAALLPELKKAPGFAQLFLTRNKVPAAGSLMALPALAATLERLAAGGLDDFYRGEVARQVAEELKAAGSPLASDDLARHRGMRRRPLSLGLSQGTLFGTAPPTQGLASLIMLGVFQRLGADGSPDSATRTHALIEAAKQALRVRDIHVADPHRMSVHATTYLSEPLLDRMAGDIDPARAADWPASTCRGTGAWLGIIDGQGRAVSYVQSLHHAFGSGVALPATGIVWHNRGHSFSLEADHRNVLEPRRKPLSTCTPALARLKDGRSVVWGSSGGDAQPQVAGQLFARTVLGGEDVQQAVSAPRWVLGRSGLELESRADPDLVQALVQAGHKVEIVAPFEAAMGCAGMLLRRPDGTIEGAADLRGDGAAAGF